MEQGIPPIEFIIDFASYWEGIRAKIHEEEKSRLHWRQWKVLCKEILPSLTKPFFERWKETGVLEWIKEYIQNYSSVVIHWRGRFYLLPFHLIRYDCLRPKNDLLIHLKENLTENGLEKVIDTLESDLNLPLKRNDLKILRKLTWPYFTKKLDQIPSYKELAYNLRLTVRTIKNRWDYLSTMQMISLTYQIDVARIGYKTMLIFHTRKISDISKGLHPHITLSCPISYGGYITIVRYPSFNTKVIDHLMEAFDAKSSFSMKKLYQGWNLEGLTQKPIERWEIRPPLLKNENWNTTVLKKDPLRELNLDPLHSPYVLTRREARLIMRIQEFDFPRTTLIRKKHKISKEYSEDDWKRLLRNRIVYRYPIFANLGLEATVYFSIQGVPTWKERGFFNVLEHLKFFPFVDIFYNEDDGVMFGKIVIPSIWTGNFLFQLSVIPQLYPGSSSQYYIGPDVYEAQKFDVEATYI
ncbi:MAG: hypothetical protein ACFFFH_19560 [Candidatus Thorarchaeota archaeon]